MATDEEEAIFFYCQSATKSHCVESFILINSGQTVKKNKQKQISWQLQVNVRGFILSSRASGLHRWAKLFDKNFFVRKTFY